MRGSDVQHPFHGVRAVELDLDATLNRCRAYEPLLRSGDAFSHITSAELYGLPVPVHPVQRELHVTAVGKYARPRSLGVVGHVAVELDVELAFGLPVAAPWETWCHLGGQLSREDLVAAGDALISGSRLPGGRRSPPLVSVEKLAETVERRRGCRGATALRWAFPRLRPGVDSRPESLLRLLCARARLPEPEVGFPIAVAGGFILHGDLVFVDARVVLEYDGDDHRLSKHTFRRDIERRELLETAGWRVIRVTAEHLFGDPDALVRRIRAVIASR